MKTASFDRGRSWHRQVAALPLIHQSDRRVLQNVVAPDCALTAIWHAQSIPEKLKHGGSPRKPFG